jgi:UDP-glucose 4-epimerase
MTKILITGGAGYIGSHTILELLNDPAIEVISIDNYSNSSEETYRRIQTISGKTIRYFNLDLCDENCVIDFFNNEKDIAGVIHFAAYKAVGESVDFPGKYYHNNIVALTNILNACVKFDIKHFIFSSSCSVYGNASALPVDEHTPIAKAESPYAHSKQIGEEIIEFYAKRFHLNAIALRYFNPVGAHISGKNGELPLNKPSNLVPVITQTAVGIIKEMEVFGSDYETRDGSCIRDYIHVSDIANAHMLAMTFLLKNKQSINFDVYNLGTGNGVSVLEAINAFEKVSGKKLNYKLSPRRAGDVVAIYSNSDKALKNLGWTCQYNIEDMMRSAWAWQLYLAQ